MSDVEGGDLNPTSCKSRVAAVRASDKRVERHFCVCRSQTTSKYGFYLDTRMHRVFIACRRVLLIATIPSFGYSKFFCCVILLRSGHESSARANTTGANVKILYVVSRVYWRFTSFTRNYGRCHRIGWLLLLLLRLLCLAARSSLRSLVWCVCALCVLCTLGRQFELSRVRWISNRARLSPRARGACANQLDRLTVLLRLKFQCARFFCGVVCADCAVCVDEIWCERFSQRSNRRLA
jgi:hypothetical protein